MSDWNMYDTLSEGEHNVTVILLRAEFQILSDRCD